MSVLLPPFRRRTALVATLILHRYLANTPRQGNPGGNGWSRGSDGCLGFLAAGAISVMLAW